MQWSSFGRFQRLTCHWTQHGATPLLVASECGRTPVVDPLVAAGAEVNVTDKVCARFLGEFPLVGTMSDHA